MVSRNGTYPIQTGRNLAPPAIKLYLSPSHWATPTASLKLVFAKLLWKLVHNPRKSLKTAVLWWNKQCDVAVKKKACLQQNETDLAKVILLFSNGAEPGLEGLY